jgi:hypothetical protein
MPEKVEQPVHFRSAAIEYDNLNEGGDFAVHFKGRTKSAAVSADFMVRKPPNNESSTGIVPWTADRFQLNCKENTRPCAGTVTVGGRRYEMDPNECHAVQDFGRGMWPYRSFWNWGVGTGGQDGRRIGINVGAKWTTGTGANENALCIDGKLHKIMEDLVWDYDAGAPMQSWRVRSTHSHVVDLTFRPLVEHRSNLNIGLLASGGVCVFGRWSGTIRVAGDSLRVTDLPGWAEEFSHRW